MATCDPVCGLTTSGRAPRAIDAAAREIAPAASGRIAALLKERRETLGEEDLNRRLAPAFFHALYTLKEVTHE